VIYNTALFAAHFLAILGGLCREMSQSNKIFFASNCSVSQAGCFDVRSLLARELAWQLEWITLSFDEAITGEKPSLQNYHQ